MRTKPSGYILHETDDIVVIATLKSANRKTADMVQVWILAAGTDPVTAIKLGWDGLVCGDCVHRGSFASRTCYVEMKAPLSVWNAWRRGSYPRLTNSAYRRVFAGRMVRFGAYGDPVLIPLDVVLRISAYAKGWTGYTHQWFSHPEYARFLMASCDTQAERHRANAQGWRTFRIRPNLDSPVLDREIVCPASDEGGHRTACANCGLCDGNRNDGRKDIVIAVHGTKQTVELVQLRAA